MYKLAHRSAAAAARRSVTIGGGVSKMAAAAHSSTPMGSLLFVFVFPKMFRIILTSSSYFILN